jgi:hypothetical protein
MHYIHSIILFGSPNGLCSSITESKHIKAVKEPWRCSSRFKALKQMLRIISRMDKLSAPQRAHTEQGMMDGTMSSYTAMIQRGEQPQPRAEAVEEDDDDDRGPEPGPKSLSSIELACTPGMFIYSLSIHTLHKLTDVFSSRLSMHSRSSCKSHPRTPICRTFTAVFI